MGRLRVVASRSDSLLAQVGGQLGGLRGANDVEMPDGIAPRRDRRKTQIADALESLCVPARDGAPFLVPTVEQGELPEQDDRLDRVEPGRPALVVVLVLRPLAMLPERADLRGEPVVVGDERPGIAER